MATVTATFVFADIAGFTALTETHGDEEAAALVGEFTSAVRAELPAAGGSRLKTIGDAVMLAIPEPAAAIRLGLRIADELMLRHGSPTVRVGLHHGQAVEQDGDYLGAAVNLAARVSAEAAGGEVLLTGSTAALAPDLEGVVYEPRGRRTLRKRAGAVRAVRGGAGRRGRRDEAAMRPGLPDGGRPRPRRGAARLRGHDVLLLLAGVRRALRP